jgi:hypothetical protein
MALAGALAVLPAAAGAVQFATQPVGLANNVPTSHENHINQDGLASACDDPSWMIPTETTTTAQVKYKKFGYKSSIQETACVTVGVSTSCTGTDAIMSESYSPGFDPAQLRNSWVGDLGSSSGTAYTFPIAGGANFETVIEQVSSSGGCPGVTLTWSSDRPWATGPPFINGLPAVGRELGVTFDNWSGDPVVQRQWLRCDAAGAGCAAIPGATGDTYVPTDADIGRALAVQDTATDNGLTSTSLPSSPTKPVVIPAIVQDGALGAGDASMTQKLNASGTPSTCAAPKSPPAPTGFNDLHLYDAFTVTSLINEPACMFVESTPCAFGLTAIYSPAFVPTSIAQNYVADDGHSEALSYTLPPGVASTAVLSDWGGFNLCPHYTILFGVTAPFATGSPSVSGPAEEGSPETTTNGEWGGSPSFQQSWLRCEADGSACELIAGASGASYTPTAADVGRRLRARISATQVNTSSADSAPSPLIGPDRTPPHGTLALARTNLRKVLKRGFIPVTATCDEVCRVRVSAVVSKKAAKRLGKRRTIARGSGSAKPGSKAKLRVKLTRAARRGLRRKSLVRFQLVATFTDARGNRGAARRGSTLRRPR